MKKQLTEEENKQLTYVKKFSTRQLSEKCKLKQQWDTPQEHVNCWQSSDWSLAQYWHARHMNEMTMVANIEVLYWSNGIDPHFPRLI